MKLHPAGRTGIDVIIGMSASLMQSVVSGRDSVHSRTSTYQGLYESLRTAWMNEATGFQRPELRQVHACGFDLIIGSAY